MIGRNEPIPDAALASVLKGVADHMATPTAAQEQVAVTVVRGARFSNRATTVRGLTIDLDEPVDFGGTGKFPDPAEYLLAAVGASLSVTLTAHAALRGLILEGVNIGISGQIHGPSFFQPNVWRRPGVLDIVVLVTLSSAMSPREGRDLLRDAILACPVLRTLKRRPRVTLNLKRTP